MAKKNGRPNGGERFGVLSARVDVLIEAVRDQREEMSARLTEVRTEVTSMRREFVRVIEKLSERVDHVEMSAATHDAAQGAVEKYRRWLIGTCAVAAGSLFLSIARALLGH